MTETSCVTAISEQGGKEIQYGNDERYGSPGVTSKKFPGMDSLHPGGSGCPLARGLDAEDIGHQHSMSKA
jgi:hypothetical protein